MDTCPYYHEHGTKDDPIPCCAHKHAPAPCFGFEQAAAEEAAALKCGGRLSNCQIPVHLQLDV